MSEQFDDAWLALREGADARARAAGLLPLLVPGLVSGPEGLQVLDLGAGTGANARWLAPRLAAQGVLQQHWRCADHDPALRACLPKRCAEFAAANGLIGEQTWTQTGDQTGQQDAAALTWRGPDWRCTLQPLAVDLVQGLATLDLPEGGLLTASALLDLVSADWLQALLTAAAARRCPLLFALTYDGRARLTPARADDGRLIGLVNRHQRTDKGFGPALGPAAAGAAAARARALGWVVHRAASDWQIGPNEPALQRALVAGWCRAARALEPTAAAWIDDWQGAREAAIDAGWLSLAVGHQDLAALPPGPLPGCQTAH